MEASSASHLSSNVYIGWVNGRWQHPSKLDHITVEAGFVYLYRVVIMWLLPKSKLEEESDKAVRV